MHIMNTISVYWIREDDMDPSFAIDRGTMPPRQVMHQGPFHRRRARNRNVARHAGYAYPSG